MESPVDARPILIESPAVGNVAVFSSNARGDSQHVAAVTLWILPQPRTLSHDCHGTFIVL